MTTLPTIDAKPADLSVRQRKLRWAVTVSCLLHIGGLWGLAANQHQVPAHSPKIVVSNDTETVQLESVVNPEDAISKDSMLEESAVIILPHHAIMGSRVFQETSATDVPLDEILAASIPEVVMLEQAAPAATRDLPSQVTIPLLANSLPPILEDFSIDDQPRPATPDQVHETSSKLTAPDLQGNALPRYPERARQLGWQGRVLLKIWISDQGDVTRVQVQKSSGHGILDAAAVTTVRGWKVRPAQRNGQPVSGSWLLPIRFRQP